MQTNISSSCFNIVTILSGQFYNTQVIRTEHIKQNFFYESETLPTPQLLTRIFSSPKLHRKIIVC